MSDKQMRCCVPQCMNFYGGYRERELCDEHGGNPTPQAGGAEPGEWRLGYDGSHVCVLEGPGITLSSPVVCVVEKSALTAAQAELVAARQSSYAAEGVIREMEWGIKQSDKQLKFKDEHIEKLKDKIAQLEADNRILSEQKEAQKVIVKQLEAELAFLKACNEEYTEGNLEQSKVVVQLQSDKAELVACVEWYGDRSKYIPYNDGNGGKETAIMHDKGAYAKETLAKVSK